MFAHLVGGLVCVYRHYEFTHRGRAKLFPDDGDPFDVPIVVWFLIHVVHLKGDKLALHGIEAVGVAKAQGTLSKARVGRVWGGRDRLQAHRPKVDGVDDVEPNRPGDGIAFRIVKIGDQLWPVGAFLAVALDGLGGKIIAVHKAAFAAKVLQVDGDGLKSRCGGRPSLGRLGSDEDGEQQGDNDQLGQSGCLAGHVYQGLRTCYTPPQSRG